MNGPHETSNTAVSSISGYLYQVNTIVLVIGKKVKTCYNYRQNCKSGKGVEKRC